MMDRRGVIGGLALSAVRSGDAMAKTQDQSANGTWTPFEFWHEDTVLVPVQCAGETWSAVLDTGAGAPVLDKAAAQRVGLTSNSTFTLHTATGVTRAAAASGQVLTVAGRALPVDRFALADLSTISTAIGREVELILGEELFRAYALSFEFSRSRMAVRPIGSISGAANRLALGLGDLRRRYVTIAMEGLAPIPAVLDLGSSVPLMIDRRYAEAAGLLDGRATSTAAIAQLTGTGVSTTLSVLSLQIGAATLKDVPAELMDDWALGAIPAVLGLPAVAQFRLSVDYSTSAVWFTPDPGASGRPILRDLSGLGLSVLSDRLRVVHVAKHGPAEGDWAVGDEIVAINRRVIDANYGRGQLWRWRHASLGPNVELRLASGESRTLHLRRYF